MNYRKCLPATILAALRKHGPLSSVDLADAVKADRPKVHNVLPDLMRDGKVQRTGRRRHYLYGLPDSAPPEGPSRDRPEPAWIAEVEAQAPYSVAMALARLEAHQARLKKLAEENQRTFDTPVSPVRSEEPE